MLHLPVTTGNVADWIRRAAGAINELLSRLEALEAPPVGSVRYQGGNLEYWNGTGWTTVP